MQYLRTYWVNHCKFWTVRKLREPSTLIYNEKCFEKIVKVRIQNFCQQLLKLMEWWNEYLILRR